MTGQHSVHRTDRLLLHRNAGRVICEKCLFHWAHGVEFALQTIDCCGTRACHASLKHFRIWSAQAPGSRGRSSTCFSKFVQAQSVGNPCAIPTYERWEAVMVPPAWLGAAAHGVEWVLGPNSAKSLPTAIVRGTTCSRAGDNHAFTHVGATEDSQPGLDLWGLYFGCYFGHLRRNSVGRP